MTAQPFSASLGQAKKEIIKGFNHGSCLLSVNWPNTMAYKKGKPFPCNSEVFFFFFCTYLYSDFSAIICRFAAKQSQIGPNLPQSLWASRQ